MADTVIEQIASILNSNIDLTVLTTDERLDLIVRLSKIFLPEWEPNSLDPMFTPLVQLAMHEEAMMSYWYRMEKERDFFSAEIPSNILAHCRSRGYDWSQTTPATATLSLVLDVPTVGLGKIIASDSIFSTDYQSLTKEDITYMLLTDVAVVQGQSSASIICSQVANANDSFVSTGSKNQEFVLTSSGYVEGSFSLTVNGDETWSEVDTFAYSTTTDKHFKMALNTDLKVCLKFGDGINGSIPVLGALLEGEYYLSLGSAGRVAADTITVFPVAYDWITSCTNSLPSDGGADSESFALAKTNALLGLEAKPADGGTGTNYVYRATTWLQSNIGLNKVRIALHNSQNVGIRIVVIMGDEDGLAEIPSSYVISQLQGYFDESLDRHNATDRIYVGAGARELQVFDMTVQVELSEDLVEMRTGIIDFLVEKFHIENINFGGTEPEQPNWRIVQELSTEFSAEIYDIVFSSPIGTTTVSDDAVPYIDPPNKIEDEAAETYIYAEDTANFTLVVEYKPI